LIIENQNYHLVNNHLKKEIIKMINFIIKNKNKKEKKKINNKDIKDKDKGKNNDKDKDKNHMKNKVKIKMKNQKYGIKYSLKINHNQSL
jgi:hypothetical protein